MHSKTYYTSLKCQLPKQSRHFGSRQFGTVDITGVDILAVDILGVDVLRGDIMGVDILGIDITALHRLHTLSSACLAGVKHVLLHMEVTSDIDLDSIKYKGSFIFGSVFLIIIHT